MCMRLFPSLATRTNLTDAELQAYFFVRQEYSCPFDAKKAQHETALAQLAVDLLRAGRIKFEMDGEEETGSIGGNSDLK